LAGKKAANQVFFFRTRDTKMANDTNKAPSTAPTSDAKKPSVLLEMRPAFDGFAGIPQEVRLLFRGLRMLESVRVAGMLQMSLRSLAKGTVDEQTLFKSRWMSEARRINRYSRVVLSAAEKPFNSVADWFLEFLERRLMTVSLTVKTLFGFHKIRLSTFRTKYFEDFIWRTLFSKTLPASDYDLVTSAEMRICSTPWGTMHKVGLNTFRFFFNPRYPKLDTKGVDIFIGQTPYPARVSKGTAFVVRYHDAIPVFMPHTIPDKALHQATHFYALMSNVKSNAYFACVSEATRTDLLRLFPEAAERAVTIPNMVSHHYQLDKTSSLAQVPGIIRSRLYVTNPADAKQPDLAPKFLTLREKETFYTKNLSLDGLKYLLIVSTVEPRKNHVRLLAAWEAIKADLDPSIKLVVVGTLGWNYEALTNEFKSWIDRGQLFMLHAVPAPDLRVLYRHAIATVCPSLGEGFDFSGVESMRSGGVVLASDIPVHREVYDNAAVYFNPYSTVSLIDALKKVVYAENASEVQAQLREAGQEVSSRYLPDRILPQWDKFLARVMHDKTFSAKVGRAIRVVTRRKPSDFAGEAVL
jgi:glycosyltransferase involved in cell wall biosynthesis